MTIQLVAAAFLGYLQLTGPHVLWMHGRPLERKWNADGMRMERGWNADGMRIGRGWNADCQIERDWNADGTRIECERTDVYIYI